MKRTHVVDISINLDEELIEWLDQLIERGIIRSRSEAIRKSLASYIKNELKIYSRKDLRKHLKEKQKKEFQIGRDVIRDIRKEEEL